MNFHWFFFTATLLFIQTGNTYKSDQCVEDFISSQGSTITFLPPIPDYVGFVDGEFITFALTDYLGIANDWIESQDMELSFGTKVSVDCSIASIEKLHRKRVRITLEINTKNANAFAFKIEDFAGDFLTPPTIFGSRAQDIVNDPTSKVGLAHVKFHIKFSLSVKDLKKGNFPDLVPLFNDGPTEEQSPVEWKFIAKGKDTNGNHLEVKQICTKEFEMSSDCEVEIVDVTAATKNKHKSKKNKKNKKRKQKKH